MLNAETPHDRTNQYYDAVISTRNNDIKLPPYLSFKRVDVNGKRCTCKSCKDKYSIIKQSYQ